MHASAQVTACCMRHVAWASQFFNPVSSEASGFLYMRPREPAAAYLHARAAAPGQQRGAWGHAARGTRRGGMRGAGPRRGALGWLAHDLLGRGGWLRLPGD